MVGVINENYDGQQVGESGQNLVNEFIDSKLSKIFSFSNPMTPDSAEVADVLIWMNRLVLLIEVKTRGEGDAPIQNWGQGHSDRVRSIFDT